MCTPKKVFPSTVLVQFFPADPFAPLERKNRKSIAHIRAHGSSMLCVVSVGILHNVERKEFWSKFGHRSGSDSALMLSDCLIVILFHVRVTS